MDKPKKQLKRRTTHIKSKKQKRSLAFKLGMGALITILSLVLICVGLFWYLSNRYYNKLDFVGQNQPDITMAPGATLEPEEDDDPEMTDSPSNEIAQIDRILDELLHKYEQENNLPSSTTPYDKEEPTQEEVTWDPSEKDPVHPSETKSDKDPAGNGPVAPPAEPTKPLPKPTHAYYDPNSAGNQGSGLIAGGVGNADMPSVGADPDVTNILLIGVDARTNTNAGRSDTMIIMSINKKTKKIVLTSILRDSYVAIPGHGKNRLNAAHAYGGAGLLKTTIELNFGIHIDYFARVNFFSFIDIVEAAGGVMINVSQAEISHINGYVSSLNTTTGGYFSSTLKADKITQPGLQLLNGRQALGYARIRYIGSDYARTERQRKVILGVVDQMRHMNFLELDTFLGKALPKISTDLTQGVVNSLVLSVPALLNYEVVQHRIPADGTGQGMRIDGKSVIAVDLVANRNLLNQIVYGR